MPPFATTHTMKRDQMLMEAVLGKLLEAPEPQLNTSALTRLLNADDAIIRHHLRLLRDKGWVAEAENGNWRLTNAGHDYLEGTPETSMSLKSLG
jgi:Mn-dependent DtxR family transcriptional regulator